MRVALPVRMRRLQIHAPRLRESRSISETQNWAQRTQIGSQLPVWQGAWVAVWLMGTIAFWFTRVNLISCVAGTEALTARLTVGRACSIRQLA
jgi:hypothetical protein